MTDSVAPADSGARPDPSASSRSGASGDAGAPAVFYRRLGRTDDGAERFIPTDFSRSVWSTEMQHGSPPAALMVRAIEREHPRTDARLARVTVDLLGPVPMSECRVRTRILRPGRSIELVGAQLDAELPDGTERTVATASAWRMATEDTAAAERTADAPFTTDGPLEQSGFGFFGRHDGDTFLDAVDWRWHALADGSRPGSVRVQSTAVLVEGEQTTAMERMFSVVDAANGVGATLDPAEWTFLNTEMTVHIHRVPAGSLGITAAASVGPDGIGLCSAVIHDEDGPVARTAQSLLVRRRS